MRVIRHSFLKKRRTQLLCYCLIIHHLIDPIKERPLREAVDYITKSDYLNSNCPGKKRTVSCGGVTICVRFFVGIAERAYTGRVGEWLWTIVSPSRLLMKAFHTIVVSLSLYELSYSVNLIEGNFHFI
jgi:hypothetical protein